MRARQEQRLTQTQSLRLTAALAASIRVLRFDASGLTRYLEEQAGRNPGLMLKPYAPDPSHWAPRWRSAFETRGGGRSTHDATAWVAEMPAGLIAHVSAQADRILGPGRPRALAQILIHAIEPSGWLGRPPADLASDAGVPLAELSAVHDRLREGADPTGLFATSLADCLRLQAGEAGFLDELMTCVLDHLDLLASGDVARLARICKVEPEQVLKALARIRSLNPKPGAQFGQGAAPVREPDLIATKGPGGWNIALNGSALPELSIDPARDDTAAAREVARMVDSRNVTLLRVGRAVLARQASAMENGLEALVPMTMAGLGLDLNLHPGTISRCVAGVSVDTPRGTWWLRALFSTARGGDLGGGETGPAAAAIRARIARLVANEHCSRPLSDRAMVEALVAEGMPVARRTVAKYREALGIPPACRRRVGIN